MRDQLVFFCSIPGTASFCLLLVRELIINKRTSKVYSNVVVARAPVSVSTFEELRLRLRGGRLGTATIVVLVSSSSLETTREAARPHPALSVKNLLSAAEGQETSYQVGTYRL